jgi:peptidoglycan-associated lipoprotein
MKMRLSRIGLALVLGLAITLTAGGCRKQPTGITPLPGRTAGLVGDQKPSDLESGKLPGSEEVKPGGGETADFNLDDMIQDRAALAAQTVYFDFDSSVVRGAEKSKVDAVVSALRSDNAAKLLIEGHCDERGTEEYNRSLGERRALALRENLATAGIDPMRVKSLSYGEDKPADSGHDESAWKKNRRGEFVLLHPK